MGASRAAHKRAVNATLPIGKLFGVVFASIFWCSDIIHGVTDREVKSRDARGEK
jgi:hypothetical protein